MQNATGNASGNVSEYYKIVYSPINKTAVVSAAPYVIKSCNDTLEITAQSLKDLHTDYITKVPAFFTMDMRYIRKMKAKGNCVDDVVYFDKIGLYPYIMEGSVSCIRFQSNKPQVDNEIYMTPYLNKDLNHTIAQDFAMCLPSEKEAQDVIVAFSKYQQCRMSGSLQNIDELAIQRLLKATCDSKASKSRKNDPRNQFDNIKKDKNGKPLPKVDVKKIKEFWQKELIAANFTVIDKTIQTTNGYTREKKNDGSYTYTKNDATGKHVVVAVPGTPIPNTVVKDVKATD